MSNMLKPIQVPQGTEADLSSRHIKVKGPLGELELQRELPDNLELHYDAEARSISVVRHREDRRTRALHGLYRSLLANAVEGVSKGFTKAMEIHGTGYNVNLRGSNLVFQVGFCHEVAFGVPDGIKAEVQQSAAQPDNPAKFTIASADKHALGQFAADIRAARPPEPYKGKGIRYAEEHVRRKEGKAFAGTD